MFSLKKLAGGQEEKGLVPLNNVAVTEGDVSGGASGYADHAYATIYTSTIIGVIQQTVDNSGGSPGDKSVLIEMSPLAQYVADTTSTMSQSLCWTNVTLDSASTVDENDPVGTYAGIIKLRAVVSTSKALVSLNFASPTNT